MYWLLPWLLDSSYTLDIYVDSAQLAHYNLVNKSDGLAIAVSFTGYLTGIILRDGKKIGKLLDKIWHKNQTQTGIASEFRAQHRKLTYAAFRLNVVRKISNIGSTHYSSASGTVS